MTSINIKIACHACHGQFGAPCVSQSEADRQSTPVRTSEGLGYSDLNIAFDYSQTKIHYANGICTSQINTYSPLHNEAFT